MITGKEPINPSPEWVSTENREYGLTIRQHLAAMAMQGILSNSTFTDNAKRMCADKGIAITDDAIEIIEPFAKLAVDCADAIIKELNK
jgi:hypothetical protein